MTDINVNISNALSLFDHFDPIEESVEVDAEVVQPLTIEEQRNYLAGYLPDNAAINSDSIYLASFNGNKTLEKDCVAVKAVWLRMTHEKHINPESIATDLNSFAIARGFSQPYVLSYEANESRVSWAVWALSEELAARAVSGVSGKVLLSELHKLATAHGLTGLSTSSVTDDIRFNLPPFTQQGGAPDDAKLFAIIKTPINKAPPKKKAPVAPAPDPVVIGPISRLDFLKQVLPPAGIFCTMAMVKGKAQQTFFKSFDEIDTWSDLQPALGKDAYFSLATYKDNVRAKTNTAYLKSIWLDLDIGNGTDYPTQLEGMVALKSFVASSGLPKPTVVSSGYGLHVYFSFTEAVGFDLWEPLALGLVAKAIELKFSIKDLGVTKDAARVLRLPGTINFKGGLETDVKLLHFGVLLPVEDYAPLLVSEVISTPRPNLADLMAGSKTTFNDTTNALLGDNQYQYPKAKFRTIIAASLVGNGCAHLVDIFMDQENIAEPHWKAGLSIAQHCSDGETAIHKISNRHSNYDPAETIAKAGRCGGPALCESFNVLKLGLCDTCQFKGRFKSPISLGTGDYIQPTPDAPILEEELVDIEELVDPSFDALLDISGKASGKDLLQYIDDTHLIKRLTKHIAYTRDLPCDTVLLLGLGVFSSVMCRRYCVTYEHGARMPIGLYVIGEQPTGTSKSWALNVFKDPFDDIIQPLRKQAKLEYELFKAGLPKNPSPLAIIERDRLASNNKRLCRSVFVSNASPEALEDSLNFTSGFFSAVADEKTLINTLLGSVYQNAKSTNSASNNDSILHGFDGGRTNTIRIGRDGYHGQVCGGTVCFAQEGLIVDILAKSDGTGLAERFMFAAESNSLGSRDHMKDIAPDLVLLAEYASICTLVSSALAEPKELADLDTLALSPSGYFMVKKFKCFLEPFLLPGAKYSAQAMRGAVAKADKQVLKIAANLHILSGNNSKIIADVHVKSAIKITNSVLDSQHEICVKYNLIGRGADMDAIIEFLSAEAKGRKKLLTLTELKTSLRRRIPFKSMEHPARAVFETLEAMVRQRILDRVTDPKTPDLINYVLRK